MTDPQSVTLTAGQRYDNVPIDALDDPQAYIAETELAPFADDERAKYEAKIAKAVYHQPKFELI